MIDVYICVLITMIVFLIVIFMECVVYPKQEDTFVQPTLPIYIISLPERKADRLDPLLANIGKDPKARYDVRKVHAVNGKREVIEGFLGKGQIGVWLSHVDMWREISVAKEPYALVLEDDAQIRLPEMMDAIETILGELKSSWDLCFLGGRYADPGSHPVKRVSHHLVTSESRIWHCHAYLITKEAARKLLEQSASFHGSRVQSAYNNVLPVDDWMSHRDRGLRIFMTDPELIGFKHDNISDTNPNHQSNK